MSCRAPQEPGTGRYGRRQRRSSRDHRDNSFERYRSRGPSRDVSFDRSQSVTSENWRDEIVRSRQNSEREGSVVINRRLSSDRSRKNSELEQNNLQQPKIDMQESTKKAGILVLPNTAKSGDRPKFPDIRQAPSQQKTLFDPKNPSKPILVKFPGGRVSGPGLPESTSEGPKVDLDKLPAWYNEKRLAGVLSINKYYCSNNIFACSDDFKMCHFPDLLRDIKRADVELQSIISKGLLLVNHDVVENLRKFLQSALEYLLCKSIKFCQTANVEHHFWKLLYYNIIEVTRKAIIDDPDNKPQYKAFLLYIIEEGMFKFY